MYTLYEKKSISHLNSDYIQQKNKKSCYLNILELVDLFLTIT
jgi:hypothetical protein